MQKAPVAARNKIEKLDLEGSGEIRRDDIAKPSDNGAKQFEITHSGNNERVNNEESMKFSADYKESVNNDSTKKEPDDLDKEKVSNFIFSECIKASYLKSILLNPMNYRNVENVTHLLKLNYQIII